jgi:pyrroline-5-carboxylate reductase
VAREDLQIGFIGGGNMAQAIIAGLLRAGHAPGAITVAEPAPAVRDRLVGLNPSIGATHSNADVAGRAAVLVLAVKPQVMPDVLAELSAARRPAGQLIISVAAGVTLQTLRLALAGSDAVRAMPNQPALIGEGMTALVAATDLGETGRAQAEYIAGSTGKALWIADETLMDAVTAVSGSGPAYFYLLMEIMEQAAVELGLPAEVARTLVRQTALGAARAANLPGNEPATLRAGVTSPGGTTAAALAVLEQAGLRETLQRAITAARDRGAELGRSSR